MLARLIEFSLRQRMLAVSYTHLDVYKRQAVEVIMSTLRTKLLKACLLYTSRCV